MFVDTSGWFCVFDINDWRHDDAVRKYDSVTSVITHSYVISEFVALCDSRKKSRHESLQFVDDLLGDASIEVIWVDEALNDSALKLLKSRLDKRWSLCDAVSMILMDDHGITDALTTDHHFEQAGLVKLLES